MLERERLDNAASVRLSVYDTESGAAEIFQLVQAVLECLNPLQGTHHQLRRLWIEMQWLKTTAQDGKLILPHAFEMVVFQMAGGHNPILHQYPLLAQRVESLARALEVLLAG